MSRPNTLAGRRTKSNRALNKSLRDLNGTWILSKSLSTGVPLALAIQGLDSPMRKAIVSAPIALFISQSNYPSSIFSKQVSSATIPSVTERWFPPQKLGCWSEWWEVKGSALGDLRARSRWIRGDQLEHDDEIAYCTNGLSKSGEYLEAETQCIEKGWRARQVWFVVNGELIKRVVTLGKDGRRAETRLVYDFEG